MEALAPSYKQGVRIYQTARIHQQKARGDLNWKNFKGINDQSVRFYWVLDLIEVDPVKHGI